MFPHFYQRFDAGFTDPMLDAVNVHPLSHLIYRDRTYELSHFMSKELQLRDFRDFFLATYPEHKPVVSDEDNAASIYCDETGWTIHRKRAWLAVLCGSHYDYIDFSIQAGAEAGTEESRRCIRTWMKHLSEFIHTFDFIHAKPMPDWIQAPPAPLVAATLARSGADYIAYLADSREVTEPAAAAHLRVHLFRSPNGDLHRALFLAPNRTLLSRCQGYRWGPHQTGIDAV